MCTSRMICVTNRHLVTLKRGQTKEEALLERLEVIGKKNVTTVLLREKDMEEEAYYRLAKQVMSLCESYQMECILHNFPQVALQLGCKSLHLPLWKLKENPMVVNDLNCIGVSVHSKEEAIEAYSLNASYLIAGHIYKTNCKQGLAPRGLTFFKEIVDTVPIPVYGIGGMTEEKVKELTSLGGAGGCIMSGYMR